MGWEKSRDRQWLSGKPPDAQWSEVRSWLKEDPIWQEADKISFAEDTKNRPDSHVAKVYHRHIERFIARCKNDTFDISIVDGRVVQAWIMRVLVDIYQILKEAKIEREEEEKRKGRK